MSDLVERYVHQVGRHVPQKEREEIQAELRSQIHDQLDDRYEGAPTADNVADVLRELGDPRQLALSYGGAQYLIGPELYQPMMSVLRRGWVIVPVVVVLVNLITSLFDGDGVDLVRLLVHIILNVMQALWIFSAIVVAIFAMLQHSGEDLDEITGRDKEFDPLTLPEVDDPAGIDRVEVSFGIAIGTITTLVLLYYLRVGGLTLRFNLSDPGDVIPAPATWLIVLILAILGQVVVNIIALRRNRWTMGTLLGELAFGLLAAVGLYFAVFEPLWGEFRTVLIDIAPEMADIPFFDRTTLIVALSVAAITLVESLMKIVKLVFNRQSSSTSYNVKAGM